MAASSSSSSHAYDVFLSFRGEDTRKTFTDHLYHALKRKGISTFMDADSVKGGDRFEEVICRAIEDSTICIPILSRYYADSRWCLNELDKMVQWCDKKIIIIPVFYHIDPSDVRHQTGTYGDAFKGYQLRVDEDPTNEYWSCKIKKWRTALTAVAAFSGYDIKNVANGFEAQSIIKIVERVEEILASKQPNNNVDALAELLETQKKIMDELPEVLRPSQFAFGPDADRPEVPHEKKPERYAEQERQKRYDDMMERLRELNSNPSNITERERKKELDAIKVKLKVQELNDQMELLRKAKIAEGNFMGNLGKLMMPEVEFPDLSKVFFKQGY